MSVEIIREKERFLSLADQWCSLTTGPEPLSPALSHEWFSCWIDAFGEGCELSLIALYEANSLVGVAPLRLVKSTYRGIPCRQLRFLYNRHAPRCAFLVRDNQEELVRSLLEETLRLPGWDVAILENIPHDSLLFELSRRGALSAGFSCLTRNTMSSPFLKMGGSWQEFFESRPRNLRRSLHNKENRIAAAGRVTVEHITDSEAGAAVMETLFRVGDMSWKAARGRAIGSDPQSRKFYSLLAETFGRRGELHIWLMRLNGEAAAFEFHISRHQRVQALRAEFDEKYRDLGVGSVLDKEIIKRLFELRFEQYDMGGEADFYKLRWTDETRHHSELLIFRKSGVGKLLHTVEIAAVEPIKKLVKPVQKRRI